MPSANLFILYRGEWTSGCPILCYFQIAWINISRLCVAQHATIHIQDTFSVLSDQLRPVWLPQLREIPQSKHVFDTIFGLLIGSNCSSQCNDYMIYLHSIQLQHAWNKSYCITLCSIFFSNGSQRPSKILRLNTGPDPLWAKYRKINWNFPNGFLGISLNVPTPLMLCFTLLGSLIPKASIHFLSFFAISQWISLLYGDGWILQYVRFSVFDMH